MNIPKELINVIGIVVVAAVLATGALAGAVPLVLQARQIDGEAVLVDTSNATYQAQIDGLRLQEARFDEIEAELAILRTEIPARNSLDDVFEIVADAAEDAGVTVTTIAAADAEEYAARRAPGDEAPPAPPASDPAPDDTTADAEAAPAPSAPANASDAPSGKSQIPVTITVETADPASAAAFLDALRSGPRLLAIVHTELTESTEVLTLTVATLTFVRSDS